VTKTRLCYSLPYGRRGLRRILREIKYADASNNCMDKGKTEAQEDAACACTLFTKIPMHIVYKNPNVQIRKEH